MENEHKKVIEVNGVKLEVDLRYAKKIEHFKIGDKVKLLITTKDYQDNITNKICPGVIVNFEEFKSLPTIVIAYLSKDYDPDLEFAYINSDSTKYEVISASDDELPIKKEWVVEKLDTAIRKKEIELVFRPSKLFFFLRISVIHIQQFKLQTF